MVERRTKVAESCKELVRSNLFVATGGPYKSTDIIIQEALPGTDFEGSITTSLLSTGYIFDDGGRQGEAGSDLVRYIWTIEYMVAAIDNSWGKNIADTVAATFNIGDNVPLLAIGETRDPTGETVIVNYSQAQRVPVRAPRPWEQFIWMTRVKLEDYFYSSRP